MSGSESATPQDGLTGQTLIRDFRLAMDVAKEIGALESWALDLGEGVDREQAIVAFQDRPLNVLGVLTADGLGSLLSSGAEQAKMDELVEQSRSINLERFIGREAVFRTDVAGAVKRYIWAGSNDRKGTMVPVGSPVPNPIMSDITSLLPSAGIIRIGENNNRTVDRKYYDIKPFDAEAGEQVVQIELTR